MKKFRLFLCVLLIALLLVGCGKGELQDLADQAAEKFSDMANDEQLLADTRVFLDAVLADDFDGARAVTNSQVSDEKLREAFGLLRQELETVTRYELTSRSINKTVRNGVSTVTVQYEMTAGEERFLLEVSRRDGETGLASCAFVEYEPEVITGNLGNMQGATPLQWGLLTLGGLITVFVVIVLVDCCRQKIQKKWIWILIIVLGSVTMALVCTPQQFRTAANIGLVLNGTQLISYASGGFTLRVTLPVGAVMYLCLRKRLLSKPEAAEAPAAEPTQTEQMPWDIPE